MEKLEWIADTYLSVGRGCSVRRRACWLRGEDVPRQIRERTPANLAFAREALSGSAANVPHVEGGWTW